MPLNGWMTFCLSMYHLMGFWVVSTYWWVSQVALVVKTLPDRAGDWETQVRSLGQENPLEKGMATHSSILARRIPWAEGPGGLQFMGSQRVRHDWATTLSLFFFLRNNSIKKCIIGSLSYSNQRRKRNIRNSDQKRRSKALTVCRWYDTIHRKL